MPDNVLAAVAFAGAVTIACLGGNSMIALALVVAGLWIWGLGPNG